MNAREAERTARAQLAAAPTVAESAGRDAVLLLMHALSSSRASLMAHPERELSNDEASRYAALIAERTVGKPMQYIVGEQEFYGLRFRLTPDVLIPRPETEHLVEAVLDQLPRDHAIQIVDVGTGSGAIAVALAHALPRSQVVALDISEAALEIARENTSANGVGSRVRFLRSDLLASVPGERFDAVVSNPPYVSLGERDSLHPQVRDFEPAVALFSGETGLEIYERLIPQALLALKPGGLLAMEIGAGQLARVSELLRGWHDVRHVADLQGIDRVVLARRP